MKNLIIVILLTISSVSYAQESKCVKANIVFVVDWSDSMDGHESSVAEVVNVLLDEIQLDNNGAKIGVILFSDQDQVWLNLSSDEEYVRDRVNQLSKMECYGDTYLESSSFQLLHAMLTVDIEIRKEEVPTMIIIISDGGFTRPPVTFDQMEYFRIQNAKKISFTIASLYVRTWNKWPENLEKVSDKKFAFDFEDYEYLIKEIKKLDFCL